MQLNTVFQKTELGVAELTSRSLGLGQRERALLIQMDGKHTLSHILQSSPDLSVALGYVQTLFNARLISVLDPSTIASTPVSAASPELTAESFTKKKLKASRALENILGLDAQRLCLLLEACKAEDEFQDRFEKTVEIVRQMRNPSVAAAFKEVARGV
jgi:hypothetical protein